MLIVNGRERRARYFGLNHCRFFNYRCKITAVLAERYAISPHPEKNEIEINDGILYVGLVALELG